MIKQDKPSDRIQTRKETKSRRSSMVIKVLSFNIQKNKLVEAFLKADAKDFLFGTPCEAITIAENQKIERVKAIFMQLETPQIAEKTMQQHLNEAFSELEKCQISEENKNYMKNFAQWLITRAH